LDGHVYSAPVIRSEITGGKAQITGSFTEQEATELAAKINEAVGVRR
jgi:preprotein translocase subunit SecD